VQAPRSKSIRCAQRLPITGVRQRHRRRRRHQGSHLHHPRGAGPRPKKSTRDKSASLECCVRTAVVESTRGQSSARGAARQGSSADRTTASRPDSKGNCHRGNGATTAHPGQFTVDGSSSSSSASPTRAPQQRHVRVQQGAKVSLDEKANEAYVADASEHRSRSSKWTPARSTPLGAYGNKPRHAARNYKPGSAAAQQFRTPVHCATSNDAWSTAAIPERSHPGLHEGSKS